MELKYEIGVQRKIFEYIFISNSNQVILDDRTRDMAIFMGYVQAFSEHLISTDIPKIARYSNLTRPRPAPKVKHGC